MLPSTLSPSLKQSEAILSTPLGTHNTRREATLCPAKSSNLNSCYAFTNANASPSLCMMPINRKQRYVSATNAMYSLPPHNAAKKPKPKRGVAKSRMQAKTSWRKSECMIEAQEISLLCRALISLPTQVEGPKMRRDQRWKQPTM